MPPTFTTPVVTSRMAENHYNGIKTHHAEIVQGIQDQSVRVTAYNQQKAAENMAIQEANNQAQQAQALAMSEAQKQANETALKMQELDIKRAALSAE